MRHNPYLRQCPLFQGLSPEETDYALTYFGAKTKQYERGQFLHQVSFPLSRFGLVLDGTVQVYMDDMDGHQIIMNSVGPRELFGESYCFLGIDAPIYICAVTDAEILWMSPARVKAPVPPVQAIDQALSNRFIAALATRTLNLNQRIQILSQSTLRGKLTTFFSQYAADQGDTFTVPFDRASMANFLGADRSALSRELSNMRRDGILDFHRSQFRILKPVYSARSQREEK